jgi:fumarate reductase subunit C
MTARVHRPPLPRRWWRARRDHGLYMLRELTVLPLLFFVGCLIGALAALAQGEAAWQGWLGWMQRPWVLGLNTLALVASLFHAFTFFALMPQIVPPGAIDRRRPGVWIAAQWVLFGLVTGALWWLLAV